MNKMSKVYNQLRDAGFVVEMKNQAVIVSLANRPVYTYEVKIVTNYDWRYTYSRDGNTVVVK